MTTSITTKNQNPQQPQASCDVRPGEGDWIPGVVLFLVILAWELFKQF